MPIIRCVFTPFEFPFCNEFLALCPYAFEQDGGWLVVRVLRHEFAPYGKVKYLLFE